ncbi:hypothetical protein FB451DRAFT_1185710 [Mycena latifolia]|nr:hypothetical protein FB451DRAFT_1185710 [Mycena latifolia]
MSTLGNLGQFRVNFAKQDRSTALYNSHRRGNKSCSGFVQQCIEPGIFGVQSRNVRGGCVSREKSRIVEKLALSKRQKKPAMIPDHGLGPSQTDNVGDRDKEFPPTRCSTVRDQTFQPHLCPQIQQSMAPEIEEKDISRRGSSLLNFRPYGPARASEGQRSEAEEGGDRKRISQDHLPRGINRALLPPSSRLWLVQIATAGLHDVLLVPTQR